MKRFLESLAKRFGFMTATEARAQGFTHHASYYGIPLWMANPESDGPAVAVKWAPFDYVMELFMCVEAFFFPLAHGPETEPMFMFKVKGELK